MSVIRFPTTVEYLALERKPEQWLVEDLMTIESFNQIVALPFQGKTLLMMQLAHHIAQGKPFLGRRVTQGPVLFVEVDKPDSNIYQVLTNFQAAGYDLSGPVHWIHHEDLRLYYPLVAKPDDPKKTSSLQDVLHAAIMQFQPVLVIIDALVNVSNGVSENDAHTIYPVLEAIKEYTQRHKSHPCACMLIHHTNTPSNDPGAPKRTGITASRGNKAIPGACDFTWYLHDGELNISSHLGSVPTMKLKQGPGGWWGPA